MNEKLTEIRKIREILKGHGVVREGIFGSYVENYVKREQKKKSDVEILIKQLTNEKFSLLDLYGLKIELEEDLRKKVDLVSCKYIHPTLKKRILSSEVKII